MKGQYTGKVTDFMRRVLECMADEAITAEDLADQLDLSPAYARQYGICPLHQAKMIRVESWIRNKRGCPSRVFAIGTGKDAKRPEALPWSTTNKRWRERNKAGVTQANNSLAILARGFRKGE